MALLFKIPTVLPTAVTETPMATAMATLAAIPKATGAMAADAMPVDALATEPAAY